MCLLKNGLYIIYKNNFKYNSYHYASKASLLKVICWVKCESIDLTYAPMVLEEAYFSKENKWNHTNYGPYIIDPVIYNSMLAETNLLVFSVNIDASKQEIVDITNENMRAAGWDNAMLIPDHFYRIDVNY